MSYTEGRQPCTDYRPQRADILAGGNMPNVHECFGPYPAGAGVERCSGHVSFCENCMTDHHSGGWESCGTAVDVTS